LGPPESQGLDTIGGQDGASLQQEAALIDHLGLKLADINRAQG
jgi:hypothetical protein